MNLIQEFDEFMKSITHISMNGTNASKHLGNGRVMQNCVALVNAWAQLMTGKQLYNGNPCDFPINTHTPSEGDIAIWQDHVAIVLDPKNYICLSSAYNGYFYKHMTYPNWSRSGGKLLGFYTFNKPTKTSYPDDWIKTIARGIANGSYGNEPERSKKLTKLGLTKEQIAKAQSMVDKYYRNGGSGNDRFSTNSFKCRFSYI